MKRIFLTSAGFENENIRKKFLELSDKSPEEMTALFIPTAAIDDGAKAMLPKCRNDLINSGIKDENIVTYDIDNTMSYDDILKYDTVYFCGGDPEYLIRRINETGFRETIIRYAEGGGLIVGVSAGSIIFTNSVENNLGLINCTIGVHCPQGSSRGIVNTENCPHIDLTNVQAILLTDSQAEVIE